MVTAMSSPSGTAAIARMIEVRSMLRKPLPIANPTSRIASVKPTTMRVSVPLKAFRRICSGVSSSTCSCRLVAILPSSVAVPVRSTRSVPRPVMTVVPI